MEFKKVDLPVLTEEQAAQIRRHIDEATKKSAADFDETLSNLIDKLEPLGWTLPVDMAIYPIKVLGKTDEIQDISDFFVEYFTVDNYRNFNLMLKTIKDSVVEERFKRAVNECIFSFMNKKYIITVNTLVSVIEGMLSLFHENPENIRMMQVCKQMVESIEDNTDSIIEKYIWKSYSNFINNLYAKKSFSGAEPAEINRHWLLHGRSEYNVTEMDCIKLFNAVSTICCTINQHEKNKATSIEPSV